MNLAIKNPHLLRAMLQRVPRGCTPPRNITAPDDTKPANLISEDERLAYFAQSAATVGGRVPHRLIPRNRSLVPVSSVAPATNPPLAQGATG